MHQTSACQVCGGRLNEFLDLGRQPLSDAFVPTDSTEEEFFFHLVVGACADCTMVQLVEEVPRGQMFHEDYPYRSSGSSVMREHFASLARRFLETELTGPDPLIVELGCNDGVMLREVASAGVGHLGVEPSAGVAAMARERGVDVRVAFFEEEVGREIAADRGPADVIYGANTVCHIPYMGSIFAGVDALLATGGVFVFEDPYLGDVLDKTSFDQIYDEHFYLFSATSVARMAERFGFELVDVERLPVHGGEVRYWISRAGERAVSPSVTALLAEEQQRQLTSLQTLEEFAANVRAIRRDLVALLQELKADGKQVVGYGATAKSATVNNFCGIGPDLVSRVYDTTPAKQGRLTPGTHIPVVDMQKFSDDYPDYCLLYAWNHAQEIMANESEYEKQGGRWITYFPKINIA